MSPRPTAAPSIPLTPVLLLMLFIAVFAGFQGGRYIMANRLQELGIGCSGILFALGAWRGLFLLPRQEWRSWVLSPLVLIGAVVGISGLVFVLNYGGNLLFSMFSAREFLLALLGPGVYLLVRCGLPLARVERVIWLAMLALMLNYLYFYFTLDLRETFFSPDHTVSNLVTYDTWRGFRLKPPLFAIMVALLGAMMMLTQLRYGSSLLLPLVAIALAAYIWSIVMFRSTLATMLFAVLLYPLLLSHRNRLHVMVVAAPLACLLLPAAGVLALDHFLQADGGSIRARAFLLAFEHLPGHLLLGAGEDSAYGLSYQAIVAPFFYPSDLGLVGVAYKYGLIGVGLYLYMHGKIWLRLWRANLHLKSKLGRCNPLIWGLLMFMTAQTFNLALNPGLAFAQGITLGSLALSLATLSLKPWLTVNRRTASTT